MLVGVGWSTPHPCRFTVAKKLRYTLQRRLDGSQGRSGEVWRRENIFLSQEFEPEQSSLYRVAILSSLSRPLCLSVRSKNCVLYMYILLSVDVANVICDTSIYLRSNSCIMYIHNFVHKSCLLCDIRRCFVCILSEFLSSLI